jgi:hypothetical protein
MTPNFLMNHLSPKNLMYLMYHYFHLNPNFLKNHLYPKSLKNHLSLKYL